MHCLSLLRIIIMIFEKHLLCVSRAADQRLGIMRKFWHVFHDRSILLRSFWNFVLPEIFFWYCSAADSHLKLLDRVVRHTGFIAGVVFECNLAIADL